MNTTIKTDSATSVSIDHARLLKLVNTQVRQIEKRFPNRGITTVAKELRETTIKAPATCAEILKPNRWIRAGVFLLGALMLAVLGYGISQLDFRMTDAWSIIEGIDAGISTAVYLGVTMVFLVSLEIRQRRQQMVKALLELRALAHVIDMHQMTKDPESLIFSEEEMDEEDQSGLTPFLLERYLDYAADLLSIIGKVAAWYAQEINDPKVLVAITELEQLTGDMNRKIWQKIQIITAAHLR